MSPDLEPDPPRDRVGRERRPGHQAGLAFHFRGGAKQRLAEECPPPGPRHHERRHARELPVAGGHTLLGAEIRQEPHLIGL